MTTPEAEDERLIDAFEAASADSEYAYLYRKSRDSLSAHLARQRAEIARLTAERDNFQPWYCCGGDNKCDGACQCQCHALRASLEASSRKAEGLERVWERGCYCLMEMMQAYERRIRSDCTTPEQLEKRPWEGLEYNRAAEYLRAAWPPDAALSATGEKEQP